MYVGIMRNFKEPPEIAYLTAKMSKYYNIEIIYLTPQDIDIEKHEANGKILVGEEWVQHTVEIPKLIDIARYCYKKKNRKVIQYLQKNVYLTDNRKNPINKEKLQEELLKDKRFSHLVIPTSRFESIEYMMNKVKQYGTIVIKPINGERGKGIYIIKKKGLKYIIGHNKEEKTLSKGKLAKFFVELDKVKPLKRYIIQKYVSSRTLNGDPFDCRLHFEKNGQGRWVIAKMYIRIGIGQTVISNMNQGGAMAEPIGFLQANFPHNWEDIYQRLLNLGEIFPYKYEELRKEDLMTLGIDIGIDQNGQFFIFEANSYPYTAPLRAEVVNLRTQYYRYLIDNKIDNFNLEKNN